MTIFNINPNDIVQPTTKSRLIEPLVITLHQRRQRNIHKNLSVIREKMTITVPYIRKHR
ncbi:hypothetical protein COCAGNCG_00209 [Aeromonas dhakensis]